MKAEQKIKLVKYSYMYLPFVFLIIIALFGNSHKLFTAYKFFTLFLFGSLWAIWVSLGSILTNKYVFVNVPKYSEETKNHPWFKTHWTFQLADIILNLSFIIVLFVILNYFFKRSFLVEGNLKRTGVGLLRTITRLYLFLTGGEYRKKIDTIIKTGDFKYCSNRDKDDCQGSFFCKFQDDKCVNRNESYLNDYSKYITSNINILNAFLTVYFQSSVKNKMNYFLNAYMSDKSKFYYIPQ